MLTEHVLETAHRFLWTERVQVVTGAVGELKQVGGSGCGREFEGWEEGRHYSVRLFGKNFSKRCHLDVLGGQ